MSRVFRYEVPVDDEWHELTIGKILHVATRDPNIVEVWALDQEPTTVRLRVYGTGQEVSGEYVGTAFALGGVLVWHLFRATAPSIVISTVRDLRRGDRIMTTNGPDWPYGAVVDHVRELGSEYGNVWDANGYTLIECIPLDSPVWVERP